MEHINRDVQSERDWSAASRMVLAVLAALTFIAIAAVARAAVKPGDLITPANASKVKDLVSPGVYYKVENGMTMKIVPSGLIDWPPPYKEATEKYSAQVRLSHDNRSLVGYVAGQPFPLIDTNDPQAATKIMWNNVFRPLLTDDYDLRFYSFAFAMSNPTAATTTGAGIPVRAGFAGSTRRSRARPPARRPGTPIITPASTPRPRNTITNFWASARCSRLHMLSIRRS